MDFGKVINTFFSGAVKAYTEKDWYSNVVRDTDMNAVAQVNNKFYNPDNFNTELNATEQVQFGNWVTEMKNTPSPADPTRTVIHKDDNFVDYDMQGYWKDNVAGKDWKPDAKTTHFDDTYKKPGHATFSVYSKYATGAYAKEAGTWNKNEKGEFTYKPSVQRMNAINKINKGNMKWK